MGYRLKKRDRTYDIIELGNNFIVISISDKQEARGLCRSLNLGSGFAGNTPHFFLQAKKIGDSN